MFAVKFGLKLGNFKAEMMRTCGTSKAATSTVCKSGFTAGTSGGRTASAVNAQTSEWTRRPVARSQRRAPVWTDRHMTATLILRAVHVAIHVVGARTRTRTSKRSYVARRTRYYRRYWHWHWHGHRYWQHLTTTYVSLVFFQKYVLTIFHNYCMKLQTEEWFLNDQQTSKSLEFYLDIGDNMSDY